MATVEQKDNFHNPHFNMTHDYKRNGTTTLFPALSMLDGKVTGDCMPRHRHQEFIRFLKTIDGQIPARLDLHLIVDNYGTHKHPGKVLAQTAPTVAFALYSNSQFLVEPDRALVPRAYRQTHSSRHVPECACIDCCHQRLYRQSQPTSSGVCMDGTCRTDSGQSSQK